jgi:UDP-N-acetylglucosamine--N-acetylmuramyl-(pentapeptide) pyrophosphoryl-undecaprenol N-acetylglucosamine transferase
VVRRVFLAFEVTRKFFKAKKIEMSGNPIRGPIARQLTAGEPAPAAGGPLRLFVCGGSQGAVAVNELVCGAAALLAGRQIALGIVHQTGERDLEATRARYAAAGIEADCRAFIDDMATEYRRCDVVISRAGATTIAELGVVGRPAILVPYPHAADNHQEINAREMAAAGAALLFRQAELTAESLAGAVAELAGDPERRERMGSAMKALGRPEAAATICDWLEAQRG